MQGKRVDTQRERRGHEFLPEADTLGKIPVLYGTEGHPRTRQGHRAGPGGSGRLGGHLDLLTRDGWLLSSSNLVAAQTG